ncbi:MAG: flagellar basal body P-ring formation protein FlgA [Gemmatimonadetes bacterium]|nr:flagellar basal body P-ring formation protein FlgA [Gemmatimonadota bacterium]
MTSSASTTATYGPLVKRFAGIARSFSIAAALAFGTPGAVFAGAIELPAALGESVRSYLRAEYPGAVAIEITSARLPLRFEDHAAARVRVESPRVLRKTGPIPFRLIDPGPDGDRSIGTLWIEAEVLQKALVAKTALKRETKLKEALLVTARVNVRKVNGALLHTWPAGRDIRLKRALREGQPVLASWIEAVPDVLRGETIHVFGQNHGLEIALAGTAMEEGFIGDIITVKNETSGKRIEVEVTGRRRGEILQGDNG